MKLPHGWTTNLLCELVDVERPISYGIVQTGENRPDGVPCVRVIDLISGSLNTLSMVRASAEISHAYRRTILKEGDIIIALRGEIGKVAKIGSGLVGANLTRGLALISKNERGIDSDFLFWAVQSPFTKAAIRDRVNGTALKEIPIGNLRGVSVLIPESRIEQLSIAHLLDAWQLAENYLSDLLEAKCEYRIGLTQQLLTGQKRFREFKNKRWRRVHLQDAATESGLRNNGKLDRKYLMAVTKAQGIIPMRERVQGVSFERCKILKPGWFAYNPMRLNIGSIAQWNGKHDVMVSGDYVVFHCNDDQLDHRYLEQFRRTHRWESFVQNSGNGSVRVRIWFSDLGHLKMELPSLAEQKRIVTVLETCDHEIDLLEKRLALLKEQKRGLMQKLLTGEIRVKVPKGA
jgi:type I restriction enzyme, S subunit